MNSIRGTQFFESCPLPPPKPDHPGSLAAMREFWTPATAREVDRQDAGAGSPALRAHHKTDGKLGQREPSREWRGAGCALAAAI